MFYTEIRSQLNDLQRKCDERNHFVSKLHGIFIELNQRFANLEKAWQENEDDLPFSTCMSDKASKADRSQLLSDDEDITDRSECFNNSLFGDNPNQGRSRTPCVRDSDEGNIMDSTISEQHIVNININADEREHVDDEANEEDIEHVSSTLDTSHITMTTDRGDPTVVDRCNKNDFGFKRRRTNQDADNRFLVHRDRSSLSVDSRLSKYVDRDEANIQGKQEEHSKKDNDERYIIRCL